MMRCFLSGKIHQARLTGADPDYIGSISIDPELLRRSGLVPFEQVDVYNVDNGERLTTYVIEGGEGEVRLNGAAAHRGVPGQRVIIAGYVWLSAEEQAVHVPKIVICGPDNAVVPKQ